MGVEHTFAIHAETFSQGGGTGRGSQYGQWKWAGGMALHLITDGREHAKDKGQEFLMLPGESLAEVAEKQAKLREKRSRKRANQKLKKAEEAAAQTAEDQLVRQQEDAAKAALRKGALIQPHASLSTMLKSATGASMAGQIDSSSSESDDDC